MPSGVNLLKKIPLFSKEGLGEICLIQKDLSNSMTSIVDKSSQPPATRRDQSNKYISSECESAVDFQSIFLTADGQAILPVRYSFVGQ